MNDEQQPSEKRMTVPPANAAAAAGAMLREAREAAGLHLAALAVSLKVPPARLEALEAGRIDLLPDVVFARALAASICRTLKLDPEPVLKRLPRSLPVASQVAAAAGGDQRQLKPQAARPAQASRRSSFATKPFLIGALVLALAALALVFVPDLNWDKLVNSNRSADAPVASGARPVARPAEVIEKPAATAAAAAQSPSAAAAPATAPVVGTSAPAATATPPKPAETAAAAHAPASAEAPAGDTVVFRTQSEAWISVIDAKGTPLIRKTVPAGQTVGVSGALPLRVTVGRADVTKVSVRGEPLDLAPLSKGSIARFEVK